MLCRLDPTPQEVSQTISLTVTKCKADGQTQESASVVQVPGPSQQVAAELHGELRTNLLQNVVGQYEQTGYLWENYRDDSGQGQGSHPFTGWTALIVLIAGETYFDV